MFYLDSIKYDVTIQKPALQHGIYEHVRVRAIKIKPVMLRASLMYAFRRVYGLPYNMATFDTIYTSTYDDGQSSQSR